MELEAEMLEELAMNMIRSQPSVEEKKNYCDLIIDNLGSLEEIHKRVDEIWERLKKIQKDRKTGSKEI